uniref:Uncharacterized protein n=1 Tax=Anguilla anguilla TaxID=7936 RepID=A0A0E9UBV2_ANGAN
MFSQCYNIATTWHRMFCVSLLPCWFICLLVPSCTICKETCKISSI